MFANYMDNDFSVSSYAWISATQTLSETPESEQNIGDYWINDIAAADLNGDSVDEQIVAWATQDRHINVSIRDLEGSVKPLTSPPGLIAHPDGTLDVVARGYDQALWRIQYDGSAWGNWDNEAGGLLLSSPAVVSRTSGELDVFAVGVDNQVYQAYATPTSFSLWSEIDGNGIWPVFDRALPLPEVFAPAVVSTGGDSLVLFRVGPDQTLRWAQSTTGDTWGSWANLGGMLASAPSAVSLQDGRIQVYALGMDGALWYRTLTSPNTWGAWQRLETPAGVAGDAVPVLVSPASGQVRVYLAGTENRIWTNLFNGSVWTGWSNSLVPGELLLGIGSAIGPSGTHLFALLGDGSLLYKLNAAAWTPLANEPTLSQATLLPDTQTITLTANTDLENYIFDITTGYFTGDGRQQIVVAYVGADDLLKLEVYDIQDGFRLHKITEPLPYSIEEDLPRAATGDVDGDGVEEIGLVSQRDALNYCLRVFELDTASGTAPYTLHQISVKTDAFLWAGNYYNLAGTLRIAAGDVVPEDENPNDEFVVISDWYAFGDLLGFQLRVYDHENYLGQGGFPWAEHKAGVIDASSQSVSDIRWTGVDVAVGNVNGVGLDEIIFTWPSGFWSGNFPDIYRVLSVVDCTEANFVTVDDWNVYDFSHSSFLDRLAVGDLDQDLTDEIVMIRTWTNDVVTAYGYTIEILGYEQSAFVRHFHLDNILDSVPRAFNLALGDFTGESIRVGPPTYRVQEKMASPEVFLNLPPMHRDIVYNPDTGENVEILIDNGATATHDAGNTVTTSSKAESKRDWSLSMGLETGVGGAGSKVTASLDNTYGENFSNSMGAINTVKFQDTTTAQYYDQVIYNSTSYGIWEYPVYGAQGDSAEGPQTISVVFPLVKNTNQPATQQGRLCDENFYAPSHQTYNVWSYDPPGSELDFEDYKLLIDSKLTSGGTDFVVSMSAVTETQRSSSFHNQISAGLEYSYENSLEIPLIGKAWDFSFRAYAKGSYGFEEISTLGTTFTQESSVEVDFPGNPDPSNYSIEAYLYWAKAGYLVVDYQTQPTTGGSWGLYTKTDPAFILPWYGFPDPLTGDFPSPPDIDAPPCDLDKQLFTHDIQLKPAYVQNGDTVTITATVRNFSDVNPQSDVTVNFYLGYPAASNEIGSCSIAYDDLYRNYGPQQCHTTWPVSGGSGTEKIFAVIDPGDVIDEMHEGGEIINNNIGYGLLNVANADYFDPGLREVQVYQPVLYETAPGSGYSLFIPTTNITETIRYELVPKDSGLLHIVGVQIQVLAFHGGEQFPDDNHTFTPTPGGFMATYQDSDLLPGMLESNLKLFRWDGSWWVEATCPGYETVRFPSDNSIAVPICQVGTFVLSDQAPGLFLPLIRK